jgi:hypothetical protein
MDDIEGKATEYLAHVLGKFTAGDLTKTERQAAFALACTLPDRSTISDFIIAAGEAEVARVGLPLETAAALARLVGKLDQIAYAARFASLFEEPN